MMACYRLQLFRLIWSNAIYDWTRQKTKVYPMVSLFPSRKTVSVAWSVPGLHRVLVSPYKDGANLGFTNSSKLIITISLGKKMHTCTYVSDRFSIGQKFCCEYRSCTFVSRKSMNLDHAWICDDPKWRISTNFKSESLAKFFLQSFGAFVAVTTVYPFRHDCWSEGFTSSEKKRTFTEGIWRPTTSKRKP